MYHVALIGYGYWGTNLLRNLINNPLVSEITVCDCQDDRLAIIQKNYPSIHTSKKFEETVCLNNIEIVVIATPTSTHYDLAKKSLLQKKHTLVEKPMCTNTEQAKELYNLASRFNLILYTDLTFLFNGAVEYIQNYVSDSNIGNIKYIDSTRVNLGIYQSDTNVVWDLAIHDISIIQKIMKNRPTHIRAISYHKKSLKKIDIVYIFLYYPNDILAQINCSWSSPTKIRQMILAGDEKMIIYDDVEPTQKIKIYDYNRNLHDRNSTLIDYRLGDITVPKFPTEEPLKKMLDSFFTSIKKGQYQCYSPKENIDNVYILENVDLSLKNHGELIELQWN